MKLGQISVTLRFSRVLVVMARKRLVGLADFPVQLRHCRVMRRTFVQMVLYVFLKSHGAYPFQCEKVLRGRVGLLPGREQSAGPSTPKHRVRPYRAAEGFHRGP